MSKEEIKQKFHQLIDNIEDEETLNILYEDAVEYKTSDIKQTELTEEQWASVAKGITQIEKGEFFTQEQVLKKVQEWRNIK